MDIVNDKNAEITEEQIDKLEALYFTLCSSIRQLSFRPRFAFYPTGEKIAVIRKYIRALEILEIRVPEIEPLIADIVKPLKTNRDFWAQADFPRSKKV